MSHTTWEMRGTGDRDKMDPRGEKPLLHYKKVGFLARASRKEILCTWILVFFFTFGFLKILKFHIFMYFKIMTLNM
jgi:hypothetical protein